MYIYVYMHIYIEILCGLSIPCIGTGSLSVPTPKVSSCTGAPHDGPFSEERGKVTPWRCHFWGGVSLLLA